MKVLIGVDGSDGSHHAVQFVGRLLSADKDEVVFYYTPPDLSVLFKSNPDAELTRRLEGFLCDAVFNEAKKRLPTSLAERVSTMVGSQSAAHGLLVAADESRADLLVVGARGAGQRKELDIGGIARAVVHHAHLPVLIVRPTIETNGDHPLRILLATDGSEINTRGCELLRKLTWPENAIGRLITVVESPVAGHIPDWLEKQLLEQETDALGLGYFEHQKQQCQRAREEAIRGHDHLPDMFRRNEPVVAVGHASDEVVKAIQAEHIDLVIVGDRGAGRVKRLLLGSNSEYLLAHAPCSVLVNRHHEKP